MYKELCPVRAFYLCDFTLNYLRYGNYESYGYVTLAGPAGAVSKADRKSCPILSPGDPRSLKDGLRAGAGEPVRRAAAVPGPRLGWQRRQSPEEHSFLCLGSRWFACPPLFKRSVKGARRLDEGSPIARLEKPLSAPASAGGTGLLVGKILQA